MATRAAFVDETPAREVEANRRTDARVARVLFGVPKVYEQSWGDTGKTRVWDGMERDETTLYWIKSGKPWKTHSADAERLPRFFGSDAMQIVFHLRKQWFAEDPHETLFWQFVDCTEAHGWRVDILHGHHDGDGLLASATAPTLPLAIVRCALVWAEGEGS